MKFKNIFFSLLGGMLIGACTPNEADVYLNPVKPADIKNPRIDGRSRNFIT